MDLTLESSSKKRPKTEDLARLGTQSREQKRPDSILLDDDDDAHAVSLERHASSTKKTSTQSKKKPKQKFQPKRDERAELDGLLSQKEWSALAKTDGQVTGRSEYAVRNKLASWQIDGCIWGRSDGKGPAISVAVLSGRPIEPLTIGHGVAAFAIKASIIVKKNGTELLGEFQKMKNLANRHFCQMPKLIDYMIDPTVHRFGCELLAMERIERSLADVASVCGEMSADDFACIAVCSIATLHQLHERAAWVHMDIKPANMLLREMPSARGDNPVLLCDLEHARPIDVLLTKHMEQPAGTIQWRSIRQDRLALGDKAVHAVPSWFDDLEALGYTLVTLAGGADGLAWSKLAADVYAQLHGGGKHHAKMRELVEAKQRPVRITGALHRVTAGLNQYLSMVRKPAGVDMKTDGRPDYAALQAIFE